MRKLVSSFAVVALLALCGTASASEYEIKQAIPSAVVGAGALTGGAMYAGLSGILIGSIIYCQSMMQKDANGVVIYQDDLCKGKDQPIFVGSTTPNPYIPHANK